MDIYCPRCTEPWDNDELHVIAEELDSTYAQVKAEFRRIGCAALNGLQVPTCQPEGGDRQALVMAAMDLSDHADDWASDLYGLL